MPCRRFQGNSVIIDYSLITAENIKSITKPYIILNGLLLFHNVTKEVFIQRLMGGMVGLPSTGLAKQETFFLPEGRVSPHSQQFPQMNSDEVEGDYKLRLNLHKRAIVIDDDGIYQWLVTSNAMIPADISQQWYESEVFNKDELDELYRINAEYLNLNHLTSLTGNVEQDLQILYGNLETLHVKMRETVLAYHHANKNKPEAKTGYTEESPPQLTLFDEFSLVKNRTTGKRNFKVRTYVEPLFFRAAFRASERARDVRKGIDAGQIYPILIAEEIEAAAESIVLCAMCLEAYINGFVQDHLSKLASYIERMETRAKWLLVPALLGKVDCFKTGSQPFDNFGQLIKWRNDDLAHYKHEFRFPVNLSNLGTVSELHSICNADNSEKAIATVRQMVRQLNECLGYSVPAWVVENLSTTSWLRPVVSVGEKPDVPANMKK